MIKLTEPVRRWRVGDDLEWCRCRKVATPAVLVVAEMAVMVEWPAPWAR